jgi:thiosulfate/3-mercaptopyruvate sulfurtransferase
MPKKGLLVSTIVSCEWLQNNLSLDNLIILDASVHTSTSDKRSHIPNSRPIDVKDQFSNTNAKFPNTIPSQEQFQNYARELGICNDSIVIVYDDKGMYWSPRIWWLFKTFGLKTIAVLDGGLIKWNALNYPIVKFSAKPKWLTGNFVADYQPNNMKYFNDILEIQDDKNHLILDARSKERFQCKVPEPREGLRSGTIPNSVNLPYTTLIENHCLKSKAELQSIFRSFTIGDKFLTFSCGSGITACILALGAEVSGNNKIAVYDGSWTEYGTLTT